MQMNPLPFIILHQRHKHKVSKQNSRGKFLGPIWVYFPIENNANLFQSWFVAFWIKSLCVIYTKFYVLASLTCLHMFHTNIHMSNALVYFWILFSNMKQW